MTKIKQKAIAYFLSEISLNLSLGYQIIIPVKKKIVKRTRRAKAIVLCRYQLAAQKFILCYHGSIT